MRASLSCYRSCSALFSLFFISLLCLTLLLGVSGGEEGALKGPSIMPGGSVAAWEHLKPIFQKIAAKVLGHLQLNDL